MIENLREYLTSRRIPYHNDGYSGIYAGFGGYFLGTLIFRDEGKSYIRISSSSLKTHNGIEKKLPEMEFLMLAFSTVKKT